jgi:hypothetical protein
MNVRTCLVTCLLLGLTTASQAQQQVRADTLSAIANTKGIEPEIPVAQVALGSTIGWALGLLAGVGAVDANGLAGGALVPVAQISISVIVERATSRNR